MVETLPTLPTVGEIARRHGVELHKVEHIVKSRRLQPVGKAGNAYIYSEVDVQFIGSELRRIQRDRDGGDRNA